MNQIQNKISNRQNEASPQRLLREAAERTRKTNESIETVRQKEPWRTQHFAHRLLKAIGLGG
jgi:hypothetical protein